MLILGSVTRIGVHNQLSIRQVLRQNERVDRRNHNIFIAVNDKRRMCDVLQGGVTTGCWYGSPFSDRGKLCHGRVPGHRKVTILLARRRVASCTPFQLLGWLRRERRMHPTRTQLDPLVLQAIVR